jgi:hypothetical protein
MESVEVWMWMIAGLILGGLVMVGSYELLSYYTYHTEVNQAQSEFTKLTTTIDRVCLSGIGTSDVNEYVYPYSVANITVENETGYNKEICISMKKDIPYCYKIRTCMVNVSQGNIHFNDTKGFFYLVQKMQGKAKAGKFRIGVYKTGFGNVTMNWTRILAD